MAKIQINSEKIVPFGGILPIMDEFDRVLSGVVDSALGLRSNLIGYQYSETEKYDAKTTYKHFKVSDFGLKPTSRFKTFVFKFVSVAAKWIKAARQNVLNIYV